MACKVIVLGSGHTTSKFIINNNDSTYIKIVGLIQDNTVSEEYNNTEYNHICRSIGKYIRLLDFNSPELDKCDMIFSPEYRQIIPKSICERYLIVNCHGGLLPKWRGFAANAWAIINNSTEIGYSIHRVNDKLDAGDIYFVKRIPIDINQTYADVHETMVDSIINEVPKVLNDIVCNENKGSEQCTDEIAFCTKFNASMGDISGFHNSSNYIINIYRCMAKPLGTGVYFIFKGKKYEIGRIEHGKSYGVANYIMTEGKVINIEDNKLWVKTQDNAVILSKLTCSGKQVNIKSIFKNGFQL